MNNTRGLWVGASGLLVVVVLGWLVLRDGDEPASAPAAVASGAASEADAVGRVGGRIDVATVARGSIEGRVLDPGGGPIDGAQVCGFASSRRLSDDDTREPLCATSGADGAYRLERLLPASYEVHAQAPGRAAGRFRTPRVGKQDRERAFQLAAGEARRGVDIVLQPGGVELRGAVKDIGGGPVEGAWVHARAGDRWGDGASTSVRSAADGSFRLWVAAGDVSLSAKADGYSPNETEAVAPGQTVEILLTPESVLAGRVVEVGSGAPVAGAWVSVGDGMGGGFDFRVFDAGNRGSTLTDGDGRFRLTRLSPGRYKPTATAPGRTGMAAESALLGLGQTVEDVVIEVHPASVIRGRVVLADGKTPCPNAWVNLEDASSQQSLNDGAEADGRIEIEAALPGTFKPKVRCDGYLARTDYPPVAVTAGKDPPDQVWSVVDGGRLVGTVRRHDGQPVAGAEVTANVIGGSDFSASWYSTRTEADGRFVIEGLPARKLGVRATVEREPVLEEPIEVAVPAGGEVSVVIALVAGGAVHGSVVDQRGAPVPGATVNASGSKRWEWFGNTSSHTRDDGGFAIDGLRPGKYRVVASRGDWGERLRAPGKNDDDQGGEAVEVIAGQTASVRLVVESQAGEISGRVVDPKGQPITDAFLDAQRESDSAAAAEGSARRGVRWSWRGVPVLTDTDGKFTLRELSPGKYTVRAYRRGGGEALAEHVAVGGSVTLTIRPTGSIAGAVKSTPAPDRMTLAVVDKASSFRRSEEFFRSNGAFTIRDLPAGSFEVSIESPSGTGKATVQLTEGQALTGVAIELASRAKVKGRLVTSDEGKPLAGYVVAARPTGGDLVFGGDVSPPTSDADGRFEIADAPAGRVQVVAMSMSDTKSLYPFVRKLVTLEGGATADLGDVKVPKMRMPFNEKSGDLGFRLKQAEPGTEMEDMVLTVAIVREDGPAAQSGLQVGDVITSVDGQSVVGDPMQYWSLTHAPAGTTFRIGLARGATVTITSGPPRE